MLPPYHEASVHLEGTLFCLLLRQSPVSLSYGKQGDPPCPVSPSTEPGREGPEVCSQGPGPPSSNVPSLSQAGPPLPSRSAQEPQKSLLLWSLAQDPSWLCAGRAKTIDLSQMGLGARPCAEPAASVGQGHTLPGSKENLDVRTRQASSRLRAEVDGGAGPGFQD